MADIPEKNSRDKDTEFDGKQVPVTPPDTQQLKQLGDYEIIGELGKGGMDLVYRARQKSLDRRVQACNALNTLISIHTRQKEYDEAAQYAHRILEEFPDQREQCATILENKARKAVQAGDDEQALVIGKYFEGIYGLTSTHYMVTFFICPLILIPT